MDRKIDPMMTCAPWNPVDTNMEEPTAESVRSNLVSLYSIHWRVVNSRPKVTPIMIPHASPPLSFFISAW